MHLNNSTTQIESNEKIINDTFKKNLNEVDHKKQTQTLHNHSKNENEKTQENIESEIRQITNQLAEIQKQLQTKQAEAIKFFEKNVGDSDDQNVVQELQKKTAEV